MVNLVSGNSLGSSIQTSEIDDESVTIPKLATNIRNMKLLETLNPSGVSTITSGVLESFDKYIITINVDSASSSVTDFKIRVNEDTGSNYEGIYNYNFTRTYYSSFSSIIIGSFFINFKNIVRIMFNGKTSPAAGGRATCCIESASFDSGGGTPQTNGVVGAWNGGNNIQIEKFTILSGGNFTGEIKIYGVNE